MTLRDTYARFLATPSTGALAENASLHYVSTTTSISDATAIIKHLSVQEKLLKKTKQNILDAVEGSRALSVDVETTVEFSNGGGAYLPGLDDNFVADRTATFPMVHVVHFDHAGKITQIRQYWDQGSLLKQIDVIGARSRNWPIRDASEQIRLISSNASASQPESAASSRPTTSASRGADEVSISSRSQRSTSNAMNDPHASLSLFAPRETEEEPSYTGQPGAPRAQSAKPPPREYSELFAAAEGGSPTPSQKIQAKSGAGKNYKPNRLFDEDDDESVTSAPSSVKTNSKKYDHFQFGDGEETPKAPEALRPRQNQLRTKNSAHWDFDDFATPDKAKPKTHPQAVRHFGWSDDEDDVSPVRRPIVHKARPDADAHFEFNDDGTPEGQRARPVKGKQGNKGQGLYDDHVTNTTDDSPVAGKKENVKSSQAVRSSMKTHWGTHADSPENRGINIAGNGMGGRKGTEAAWSLFDESPAKKEPTGKQAGIKTEGDGMGGRKTADKSFWDF